MPRPRTFGNTIHFLLAINSLQMVSLWGNRLVLSLFALELGASALVVGLLNALFSLAAATLAVQVGRVADRYGARWLLMGGSVGASLGMSRPWLLPSLITVLIAGVLGGLSLVCFNVTTQNLVGLLSPPAERARNVANYSLTMSAGALFGPLLAGFLIDQGGSARACLILAVYALAPLAVLLIRRGRLEEGALHQPDADAVKVKGQGALALLRDPGVRETTITSSILVCGLTMMTSYLPVYAHAAGLSAGVIGVVVAMNACASFIIRALLPAMIRRFRERGVLVMAFGLGSVAFLLLPFFQHPVALGLLAFVFGLGMGTGQPVITLMTFQYSPPGRTGEAMGLKIGLNHFTNLIAPLAFGGVATAAGLAIMFWGNGIAMALAGGISWSRARGKAPG